MKVFLDDLNTNFQVNYNSHCEQAVDEAMLKYKGVGPTVQMVTCVNWTFIQGNHNKESNLVLDTQWSLSCVRMYRVNGMPFSVTISLHHTSFLRTCMTTKYSVLRLATRPQSFQHACMTKPQSKE